MLLQTGICLVVAFSSIGIAQASTVFPGDPEGVLADTSSCGSSGFITPPPPPSDPIYHLTLPMSGNLQGCLVNTGSTQWVIGALVTPFPGGNLSDFQCQTTAFDLCSVQLDQNTNSLSLLFSGTSTSPGVPGGGGEVLLTLTGWPAGEEFFGSFNNAVSPVPEPVSLKVVGSGITSFILWCRFTSGRKRTRKECSCSRVRPQAA
jgi:hypothetical protein